MLIAYLPGRWQILGVIRICTCCGLAWLQNTKGNVRPSQRCNVKTIEKLVET